MKPAPAFEKPTIQASALAGGAELYAGVMAGDKQVAVSGEVRDLLNRLTDVQRGPWGSDVVKNLPRGTGARAEAQDELETGVNVYVANGSAAAATVVPSMTPGPRYRGGATREFTPPENYGREAAGAARTVLGLPEGTGLRAFIDIHLHPVSKTFGTPSDAAYLSAVDVFSAYNPIRPGMKIVATESDAIADPGPFATAIGVAKGDNVRTLFMIDLQAGYEAVNAVKTAHPNEPKLQAGTDYLVDRIREQYKATYGSDMGDSIDSNTEFKRVTDLLYTAGSANVYALSKGAGEFQRIDR